MKYKKLIELSKKVKPYKSDEDMDAKRSAINQEFFELAAKQLPELLSDIDLILNQFDMSLEEVLK